MPWLVETRRLARVSGAIRRVAVVSPTTAEITAMTPRVAVSSSAPRNFTRMSELPPLVAERFRKATSGGRPVAEATRLTIADSRGIRSA